MEDSGAIVTAFVAAAGLGAIVGLERQIRGDVKDPQDNDTYAGVRTFALYGAWGAGAGFIGDRFGTTAFLVLTLSFGLLLVASYIGVAQRSSDWGTTTEAAAFLTFIVGTLAWAEQWVAALALAVGTAYLLRSKEFFHALSRRFSDDDIQAVLQFAAITAVVLPLIPDEDLGPFDAINFRRIWLMVIFVAAIGPTHRDEDLRLRLDVAALALVANERQRRYEHQRESEQHVEEQVGERVLGVAVPESAMPHGEISERRSAPRGAWRDRPPTRRARGTGA